MVLTHTRSDVWKRQPVASRCIGTAAQPGALRQPRGVARGRGWRRGSGGTAHMCACGWRTLCVAEANPRLWNNYPLKKRKPCVDLGEEKQTPQNPKETNPDHPFPQCFLLVLRTSEMQKRTTSIPCGEGKGNPLQCSCLENPRDRGAWWATVHGVFSRTHWLSSSSRMLWSLYSCIPCTVLCRTHSCMTSRDITVGYLSICLSCCTHWNGSSTQAGPLSCSRSSTFYTY